MPPSPMGRSAMGCCMFTSCLYWDRKEYGSSSSTKPGGKKKKREDVSSKSENNDNKDEIYLAGIKLTGSNVAGLLSDKHEVRSMLDHGKTGRCSFS